MTQVDLGRKKRDIFLSFMFFNTSGYVSSVLEVFKINLVN